MESSDQTWQFESVMLSGQSGQLSMGVMMMRQTGINRGSSQNEESPIRASPSWVACHPPQKTNSRIS
ncbi:hypothetical protein CCP4SC76_650002 [Gammaproteobacteria bacterium]